MTTNQRNRKLAEKRRVYRSKPRIIPRPDARTRPTHNRDDGDYTSLDRWLSESYKVPLEKAE